MKTNTYDLIVVGGGAAGFFGAINTGELAPGSRILILEKTTRLLSKVKVSGGGRCNVTHEALSPASLASHYPRGQKPLKALFHEFQATDTVAWFRERGVHLKTEEDGRMFPDTDDSQTIIDCFLRCAKRLNIEIKTEHETLGIERSESGFRVVTTQGTYSSRFVLIATGGYNKPESYRWLEKLGHQVVRPIPSLFTFNDSKKEFVDLMGVAVSQAEVRIAGTKFSQRGPVLITHWGLSGPAVIKLSAWAAEYLYEQHYTFTALVNWTGKPEPELRTVLMGLKESNSQKQIISHPQFELPKRLWEVLVSRAELNNKTWAEAAHKSLNRLIESLFACPFAIKGKTTFKEEFVTCGGVPLSEIDMHTMQSKLVPGLFWAGEVLDIDGETGGFNFQAAWSTSMVAARSISEKIRRLDQDRP